MAIGGQKAVGNHETGARNPHPQGRLLIGKADVVDPENVTNGVAVAVQDHGRHGLFLLQPLHHARELVHLLAEVARGRGGVRMRQKARSDERTHPQGDREQAQPGLAQRFARLGIIFDHEGEIGLQRAANTRRTTPPARQTDEPLSSPPSGGFPRVRKAMYEGLSGFFDA